MSHQHSAVSLQWSQKVFRPSIIHIFCYSLMLRFFFFFLNCKYFLINWHLEAQNDKVKKKILVLAGPVKNTHGLRAFSRPPLWIRISPATHSAFTQAWTVSLSQRKAPLQGDAATAMLHSGDVAGQWAVPSFLLLWRLKLMPKCSVLLIADTESCFHSLLLERHLSDGGHCALSNPHCSKVICWGCPSIWSSPWALEAGLLTAWLGC